jgi:hypothetical protein
MVLAELRPTLPKVIVVVGRCPGEVDVDGMERSLNGAFIKRSSVSQRDSQHVDQ